MLAIAGVSRRFGAKAAVSNISLEIGRGSFVGVIGRSGAGKSTLLRMINRLIEPSEGRILFDGTEVTALRGQDLRQWRANAAMIFQQFNLVPRLDVLTNVLLGRISRHGTVPSLVQAVFRRGARAGDRERSIASICSGRPFSGRRRCRADSSNASRSRAR